jgi:hypothetical protein
MSNWRIKDKFSKVRIIVGIFLLLFSVWDLYILINGLSNEKADMRSGQDFYQWTEEDYLWQNILWRHRILISSFVLVLVSGTGIIWNKKIGWVVGISTCFGLAGAFSFLLTVKFWPSMHVVYDTFWFKTLAFAILFFAAGITMLSVKFWKKMNFSIVEVTISVVLFLAILYINNVHYLL